MKTLVYFLFLPVFGYAQEYIAEAPLSKVTRNGFYSITLPPNITASLGSNLQNIRILDNQDAEVPFLALKDQKDYTKFEWIPMPLEKEIKKASSSVITITNEKKEYLDNFLLKFKNANVTRLKTATMRGSDDREIWYAVYEEFAIQGSKNLNGEMTQVVEIPLSNYKYYQLTIDDSTSAPLFMISIERTSGDIIHGEYLEIPDVTIASRDSLQNRETWGTIEFDTAQYIDRIEFDVFGPHLYKRSATLLRRVNKHFETISAFDIISGQSRALFVGLKTKTLYIRVNNDNNPPLKFTQVAAYQFKRSLVAYFEAGRDYRIALGSDLPTPDYDIGFFKDSIPADPGELEIGSLKENPVLKDPESRPPFFTDRKYVWVAIILVGIVLATMTVRMLRDKDFKDR
jgi:hypothetical protein